jgi:PAS domain S-box-containing protein
MASKRSMMNALTNTGPSTTPDFERIFECVPRAYTVVDRDFRIVAVTDSAISGVGRDRKEVIGQLIVEAFPDNPDDPDANGTKVLQSSLERVLRERTGHTLPIQRYDIRNADGEWEVRYWRPLNEPVLDSHGEVTYIIHGVEDVTHLAVDQ